MPAPDYAATRTTLSLIQNALTYAGAYFEAGTHPITDPDKLEKAQRQLDRARELMGDLPLRVAPYECGHYDTDPACDQSEGNKIAAERGEIKP